MPSGHLEVLRQLYVLQKGLARKGITVPSKPPGIAINRWDHAVTCCEESESLAQDGHDKQARAKLAEALRLEQARVRVHSVVSKSNGNDFVTRILKSAPEGEQAASIIRAFISPRSDSLEILAAALIRFPRDGFLWYLRGVILYNRARQMRDVQRKRDTLSDAVHDFTVAGSLNQPNSHTLYFRANTLVCWGQGSSYERALNDLLEYIKGTSIDCHYMPKSYRLAAYCLTMLGRDEEASLYYFAGMRINLLCNVLWNTKDEYNVRESELEFWRAQAAPRLKEMGVRTKDDDNVSVMSHGTNASSVGIFGLSDPDVSDIQAGEDAGVFDENVGGARSGIKEGEGWYDDRSETDEEAQFLRPEDVAAGAAPLRSTSTRSVAFKGRDDVADDSRGRAAEQVQPAQQARPEQQAQAQGTQPAPKPRAVDEESSLDIDLDDISLNTEDYNDGALDDLGIFDDDEKKDATQPKPKPQTTPQPTPAPARPPAESSHPPPRRQSKSESISIEISLDEDDFEDSPATPAASKAAPAKADMADDGIFDEDDGIFDEDDGIFDDSPHQPAPHLSPSKDGSTVGIISDEDSLAAVIDTVSDQARESQQKGRELLHGQGAALHGDSSDNESQGILEDSNLQKASITAVSSAISAFCKQQERIVLGCERALENLLQPLVSGKGGGVTGAVDAAKYARPCADNTQQVIDILRTYLKAVGQAVGDKQKQAPTKHTLATLAASLELCTDADAIVAAFRAFIKYFASMRHVLHKATLSDMAAADQGALRRMREGLVDHLKLLTDLLSIPDEHQGMDRLSSLLDELKGIQKEIVLARTLDDELSRVDKMVEGLPEVLDKGDRQLFHYGLVNKTTNDTSKKRPRMFYLFSDCIVLAGVTSDGHPPVFKRKVVLANNGVMASKNGVPKAIASTAFSLGAKDLQPKYLFNTNSEEERDAWVRAITEAVIYAEQHEMF